MAREHATTFPAGYLPMACPCCGRVRLEYGTNATGGVVYVECEKCGASSDDRLYDSAIAKSQKGGRDA